MESILGGSGADTVTLGAALSGASIDLASGADVLTLASGTNNLTLSNVESVTGNTGNDTITLGAAVTGGTFNLGNGQDSLTLLQTGTANNTATSGADYTAASGTLTFNPGDTSKTIAVTIANDSAQENDETFTLTISNPAWEK